LKGKGKGKGGSATFSECTGSKNRRACYRSNNCIWYKRRCLVSCLLVSSVKKCDSLGCTWKSGRRAATRTNSFLRGFIRGYGRKGRRNGGACSGGCGRIYAQPWMVRAALSTGGRRQPAQRSRVNLRRPVGITRPQRVSRPIRRAAPVQRARPVQRTARIPQAPRRQVGVGQRRNNLRNQRPTQRTLGRTQRRTQRTQGRTQPRTQRTQGRTQSRATAQRPGNNVVVTSK